MDTPFLVAPAVEPTMAAELEWRADFKEGNVLEWDGKANLLLDCCGDSAYDSKQGW